MSLNQYFVVYTLEFLLFANRSLSSSSVRENEAELGGGTACARRRPAAVGMVRERAGETRGGCRESSRRVRRRRPVARGVDHRRRRAAGADARPPLTPVRLSASSVNFQIRLRRWAHPSIHESCTYNSFFTMTKENTNSSDPFIHRGTNKISSTLVEKLRNIIQNIIRTALVDGGSTIQWLFRWDMCLINQETY